TGGLEYRWGDGDMMVRTVEMIANREGFGDIIAEGSARMSERFGPETEAFKVTVKDQEFPMHEPRLKYALGVGYAVAPVGADHMMNIHDTMYVNEGRSIERVNSALEKKIGPVSATSLGEDKMQIFYYEVNFRHFMDCAQMCHFYPYDYQQLADVLSGVTGIEYSIRDIMDVGVRAQTLSRLFNLREGFTADDDKIPARVMKAFSKGPIAGNEITEDAFSWAKRRYYEMMNWDPETGVPSEACLDELGLKGLLA
ncbi:MAG: aldehyde ferredoxin oxidoreductase C-terminal domain-containing protein, partial [Anaerolineaceae bacterium]|nr:aldehyde ferredoxin oxidoreductase C-terminal domain-containing protein [Anaerolineaceae bacterium]